MKTNVIASRDLAFVQAVNRIMFCKPLLPERTELEKEALGQEYRATPRPWNVYLADPVEDANLATLVARVGETADRCRANLARKPPASDEESALYFNFIWLFTYYRYFPERTPTQATFGEQVEAAEWTADELLRRYVARVYARCRNYEQAARILDLDSRTVRKFLR